MLIILSLKYYSLTNSFQDYAVPARPRKSAGYVGARPDASLPATRARFLGRSDQGGVEIFPELVWLDRVDGHLDWKTAETRCL